jgi:hypothetical protein
MRWLPRGCTGILALSAGTPVLAIDYEDKARRLFGQLGVPGWSVDIESASSSLLCRTWDAFASGVDARRAALLRAMTALAKNARTTAGLLRSALVGGECSASLSDPRRAAASRDAGGPPRLRTSRGCGEVGRLLDLGADGSDRIRVHHLMDLSAVVDHHEVEVHRVRVRLAVDQR